MERHFDDQGLFDFRRVTRGDIRIAMLVAVACIVILKLAA